MSWRRSARARCIDRTPPDQVVARAKDAEIVLTNKTVLDAAVLRQLPRLKYIGVLATGYNVVDIQAARERHIPVTNVPTYGTPSVAQMVFAHLLELTQHVAHHAQTVRDGRWTKSADFCYWDFPLIELKGLTMGIVGYGRIGRETGAVAKAFGMKVLAVELAPKPDGHEAEFVSLDDLFRRSDVVSLHCPLTPETKGLVNAQRLALMKKTRLPHQHQPRPARGGAGAGRRAELRPHRRRGARRAGRRAASGGQPAPEGEELPHHAAHRLGHPRRARTADEDGRGQRPPASWPAEPAERG